MGDEHGPLKHRRVDVDLAVLAAYSEGVTDEMVLRVRRNPDPKGTHMTDHLTPHPEGDPR